MGRPKGSKNKKTLERERISPPSVVCVPAPKPKGRPKGSKNKEDCKGFKGGHKDNGPGNIFKVRAGVCYVCSTPGNEKWGTDLQYVGAGLMRHIECRPGSSAWATKFPRSFMANYVQ